MLHTLGQNSNVGKLKTLSGALDTMVRTKHAFQLIRKDLAEEFDQVVQRRLSSVFMCLKLNGEYVHGRGCVCIVCICIYKHTQMCALHKNTLSWNCCFYSKYFFP